MQDAKLFYKRYINIHPLKYHKSLIYLNTQAMMIVIRRMTNGTVTATML